jgi:hypothetical protein
MNSSLIIYAIAGAIGFCLLSTIATKYRGDEVKGKSIMRDCAAGAIFTASILFLIPDMFPPINVGAVTASLSGGATSAVPERHVRFDDFRSGSGNDDFDLQVGGYPKRR